MKFYTEIVTYRWTEVDTLATLTPVLKLTVSPYSIPSGALGNAQAHVAGDYVDLPLNLSTDLPTIARFYRDGYEWVPIPPDVTPGDTMLDLFQALYAYDPVLFAHCDIRLAALDTGINVIEDIASGNIPSLKKATPLADLAQLHFEYWGNTDLRYAVYNATVQSSNTIDPLSSVTGGLLTFPLGYPKRGSDLTSLFVAELEPAAIPTSKDDASIQWVLARCPVRGVPVAAAPAPKGGGRQMIVSVPPARIELDGWNRQVLEPVSVKDMKTRAGKVQFRITLPRPAKEVMIEILKDGVPYYAEKHGLGEFLLAGPHLWAWDGYSQDGVYDSNALRTSLISARVTTVDLEGRVAASETTLGTGPDTIRWTEATIDTKTKVANVAVYANIINPSDIDLASFSLNPAAMLATAFPGVPGLSSLPGAQDGLFGVHGPSIPGGPSVPGITDPSIPIKFPSGMDLDKDLLALFKKNFVVESIERHWSYGKARQWHVVFGTEATRPAAVGGEAAKNHPEHGKVGLEVPVFKEERYLKMDDHDWELAVSCHERATDGMTIVLANGDKDPLGARSTNIATFMEGLPIIDQYLCTMYPKADVGAHELGHSILRENKGVYFSLTHKGTSTPGQDSIKSDESDTEKTELAILAGAMPALLGGSANEYPSSPSCVEHPDVMLYFNDDPKYYTSRPIPAHDRRHYEKALDPTPPDDEHGNPQVLIDYRGRYLEASHAVPEDAVGLLWMTKVAFG